MSENKAFLKLSLLLTAIVAVTVTFLAGCNNASTRGFPFGLSALSSRTAENENIRDQIEADTRANQTRNAAIQQASFDSADGKGNVAFAGGLAAPAGTWHQSYETALEISRRTGKPILADFTGSDWCSWCVKLKKNVFDTAEFKEWAKDNVVLLELDYPQSSSQRASQPPEIKQQNQRLKNKYKVSGYPTVLFLDSKGGVYGKIEYKDNPTLWIKAAETLLNR